MSLCDDCCFDINLQRLLPLRSEERVLKHSLFNASEIQTPFKGCFSKRCLLLQCKMKISQNPFLSLPSILSEFVSFLLKKKPFCKEVVSPQIPSFKRRQKTEDQSCIKISVSCFIKGIFLHQNRSKFRFLSANLTDGFLNGHKFFGHFFSRKESNGTDEICVLEESECIFEKKKVTKLTSVLHRVVH